MGNLVWTGVLYSFTITIVFVCYRAFMQDRRVEQESGTRAMINSAYLKSGVRTTAVEAQERAAKNQIPGTKAPTPPWIKAKRA
jgi:hypothetical protein